MQAGYYPQDIYGSHRKSMGTKRRKRYFKLLDIKFIEPSGGTLLKNDTFSQSKYNTRRKIWYTMYRFPSGNLSQESRTFLVNYFFFQKKDHLALHSDKCDISVCDLKLQLGATYNTQVFISVCLLICWWFVCLFKGVNLQSSSSMESGSQSAHS